MISGNTSAEEAGEITIQCSVQAKPQPKFTWLKTSLSLNEVSRVLTSPRITITSERSEETATSVSTLQISMVTVADSGKYLCEVNNELPTASPVSAEWAVNVTDKFYHSVSVALCFWGTQFIIVSKTSLHALVLLTNYFSVTSLYMVSEPPYHTS